jgi:hypothetical protein
MKKTFWLAVQILVVTFPAICQDRVVEHGRYMGSILVCDNGYWNVGGRCEELPPVTNGSYLGSILMCDNGYRNVGGQCEELPPVANGSYLGSMLMCDNGYRNVGGRCEGLPSVANGSYLGSMLMCDNGYRNAGGRCEGLPSVANGSYLGSMLMCDNGYKNVGGKCDMLPSVPNAAYFGHVVVCDDGFIFHSGKCNRSATTQPFALRFDSTVVYKSRQAPVPTDPFLLFGPYFSQTPSAQYRSGSTFDAGSGNRYRWIRRYDGSTVVNGMNLQTGSVWTTTIGQDGSMNGFDKNMNSWTYNARTGFYMNYGTGKICTGRGPARSCF